MWRATEQNIWQGRIDANDNSRIHQVVSSDKADFDTVPDISLIGFCCDQGVIQNQGRPGAKQGPDALRRALANLVLAKPLSFFDAGNICCDDGNLGLAQTELAQVVTSTIQGGSFPIVLGGGHEVAWGSYQGIRAAYPDANLGIINFDAHFDLRSPAPEPSSGSPFRQICEASQQQQSDFNYLVLGINESVNTPELFDYARQHKVTWITDIEMNHLEKAKQALEAFASDKTHLYLSICLDVMPAAYAPGVSAPASLGVEPWIVVSLIKHLKQKFPNKVVLLDIAELNPSFDIDQRTAKLAARLVHTFLE